MILSTVVMQTMVVCRCDFCMLGQGVSPYLLGDKVGITLQSTTINSNQVYDSKDAIAGQGKKESWTVTSLGKAVGLSKSAFAIRFKSTVGQTPIEHLTQRRILKAARLLEESDSNLIEDVANVVGYESESTFRKSFRRKLGVSLRDYRSGNKKNLNEKEKAVR